MSSAPSWTAGSISKALGTIAVAAVLAISSVGLAHADEATLYNSTAQNVEMKTQAPNIGEALKDGWSFLSAKVSESVAAVKSAAEPSSSQTECPGQKCGEAAPVAQQSKGQGMLIKGKAAEKQEKNVKPKASEQAQEEGFNPIKAFNNGVNKIGEYAKAGDAKIKGATQQVKEDPKGTAKAAGEKIEDAASAAKNKAEEGWASLVSGVKGIGERLSSQQASNTSAPSNPEGSSYGSFGR